MRLGVEWRAVKAPAVGCTHLSRIAGAEVGLSMIAGTWRSRAGGSPLPAGRSAPYRDGVSFVPSWVARRWKSLPRWMKRTAV
jgi:hypothetical protein